MDNVLGKIKELIGNRELMNVSVDGIYKKWYQGKTPYHYYYVYNGTEKVQKTKKTLGMAYQVCEDWANILMCEDTLITCTDKDNLNKMLDELHFKTKLNQSISKSFGIGFGAVCLGIGKMYVDENGNVDTNNAVVKMRVIDMDNIYPISDEDGDITECVFASLSQTSANITAHLLNADGTYDIYSVNGKGENESYEWGDIKVLHTKSKLPLFQIIKYNATNNKQLSNDVGLSVFANAIDTLEEIDDIYDSFNNEFQLGRKRIMVSDNALSFKISETGEKRPTFDSKDVVFYRLPQNDDSKDVVKEINMALRVQEHIQALNINLNLFSSKCGLGESFYKFDATSGRPIQTATASIIQQLNLYRSVKKQEKLFNDIIVTLVKGVIYLSNTFTINKINSDGEDIKVQFDDSILIDRETAKSQDQLDVTNKIMSKIDFRMKWYGEDYETALKYLQDNRLLIDDLMPALQNGAITPSDFVELVYGKDNNFNERVAYITDNLKTGNDVTDLPDLGI